jgi:protease I
MGPQLNSPVGWAVAALRWSPRPSIPGALAGLMAGARLSPKSPSEESSSEADTQNS